MLDRSVIQRILPHRSPFLLVDLVSEYNGLPKPFIQAEISTSYTKERFLLYEESIWPLAYIIEGLGQSFLLLSILYKIESEFGIDKDPAGFQIQRIIEIIKSIEQYPKLYQNNGLLAHVDLKQHKEVKMGKNVHYRIDLNMNQGKLFRYKVEAKVDNECVVDGFMIGSQF